VKQITGQAWSLGAGQRFIIATPNLKKQIPDSSLDTFLAIADGIVDGQADRAQLSPTFLVSQIPASPVDSEQELSNEEIAEIEYRFEALAPYQKPGSPDCSAAVQ
jgi:hypothetical protein